MAFFLPFLLTPLSPQKKKPLFLPLSRFHPPSEDTIREAFGIPCSKNIFVNFLTNSVLSFFTFGFLGQCPTLSQLLERQARIRPLYYTFNFKTKSWGWSPEPKHQIRRAAGEYPVRSSKFPAVWQKVCKAPKLEALISRKRNKRD